MSDRNNRSPSSRMYSSLEVSILTLVICFTLRIFPEATIDVIIAVITNLMFNSK